MATNSPSRPAEKTSRTASTKQAAAPDPKVPQQTKSSGNMAVNWLRAIVASFLGLLTLYFIVGSVTLYWFNHTIANTDKFTSVTSSLAKKPAIQNFITQKATTTITDNLSNKDIASHVLTPAQAAAVQPDQLKALATPIVQTEISQIVTSPQFNTLWTDTTRNIQSQTLNYLNGPGTGELTLNFKPTVDGLVNLLQGSKLSFIQPKDLNSNKAQVTIKSKQAQNAHKGYQYIRHAPGAMAAAAVVTFALMVVVARKRLHAIRHLSWILGLGMLFVALLIHSLSQVKLTGADLVQKQAALSFISTTLHGLMQLDLIVGILALVVVVLTFLYHPLRNRFGPSKASKALREL